MNSESDQLCAQCSRLDLYDLFHRPIEVEVNGRLSPEIELGFLHEIAVRKDCPFCRLITETIKCHYNENDLPRSFWQTGFLNGHHVSCVLYNTRVPCPEDDGQFESSEMSLYHVEIGTAPAIYRSDLRADGEDNQEFLLPMIQMLHPPIEPDSETTLPYGALVTSQIKIGKPVDWLGSCQKHGRMLSPDIGILGNPREMRLIDVLHQCIVPAPERASYVALSYVWGGTQQLILEKATTNILRRKGSLLRHESLPGTIRDAAEFVRRLGERYLWVDSLCIVQDDERDVMFQVHAMESVYANALLVLVAAAGHNADAGLPGVMQGSRVQRQHVEAVGPLRIANLLGNKRELIDRSVWNSRAWTYQERILASRLLTFTKDQIFFECRDGCSYREEIHSTRKPEVGDLDFPYHPLLRENINFDVYARFVSEYTGRQMTQPSDAVKALSGVLQLLEYAYGERKSWVGLPAVFFDAALLWRPAGPTRMRTSSPNGKGMTVFPSWTWAGWEGKIHYPDLLNFCVTTRSCVVWKPDDSTRGNRIARNSPPISKLSERHFDPDTLSIYYTRKGDPGLWFSQPIAEQGFSPGPKSINGLRLRLEAPMATFNLTGEHHTAMKPLFLRCTEEKHTLCPLAVFDGGGYVAGTVFVDADIGKTLMFGTYHTYEFVALSRTTLYRIDEDPAWDNETKAFLFSEADRKVPRNKDDTEAEEDSGFGEFTRYFDYARYSPRKYWPLYNVLLLLGHRFFRNKETPAYQRAGIGKIHVDAFDQIAQRKILDLV